MSGSSVSSVTTSSLHQKSTVASVDPLLLPLSRTLRFRDSNIEGISLVNAPNEVDGVLVDQEGAVAATWSSFCCQAGGDASQVNRGIGSEVVKQFVDIVTAGPTVLFAGGRVRLCAAVRCPQDGR